MSTTTQRTGIYIFTFRFLLLEGKILSHFKNQEVLLAGDRRCGSPAPVLVLTDGNGKGLDLAYEIVDKRQVQQQSPNMKRKVLK